MTEYIKNPISGKLRGVTYEDGKIIDVHIRDTDDVVKVFVPVRHGRWIDGDPYCPICRKDKFRGLDAMYGQIGSQTTAQIAARGWIWRSKLWV